MAVSPRCPCDRGRTVFGHIRRLRTAAVVQVFLASVSLGPAVVEAREPSLDEIEQVSREQRDPRITGWLAFDLEPPGDPAVPVSDEVWLPIPLAEGSGCGTVSWSGTGDDLRWSNPDNWTGHRVPDACHTVRFDAGGPDAAVDPEFGGSISGLVLAPGYDGTVWLGRDLRVEGAIEVSNGKLEQARHRIAAASLLVTGGAVFGGSAPFWIEYDATVRGGVVVTPSDLMRVESLEIVDPGVVRMGRNGKLEIAGNGDSFHGDGFLDTRTHTPNSIELTGDADRDLTGTGPLKDYPAFGQVGAALDLRQDEDVVYVALMDPTAGYMYLGTNSSPGYVIKVRLSDFSRVGAIALDPADGDILSGVIDLTSGSGYAYFGTEASPARVVKIDLGTFEVADVMTLATGENSLLSAVIDPVAGYAYFASSWTPPKIIRISLVSFTRDAVLDVTSTTKSIRSAAIDPVGGYAYFGAGWIQVGDAVKVRLSDFTVVDTLTFASGETSPVSAVIDPSAGFLYFGTRDSPGKVVKIDLTSFTRVGSLTLNSYENWLTSAVIDTAGGYAYFGTQTNDPRVIKVDLSTFTRDSGTQYSFTNGRYFYAGAIDTGSGFAYFSGGTTTASGPAVVSKIRLSDLVRTDGLTLSQGENLPSTAVLDDQQGFAYFGCKGRIVKVRLSDFSRVGAATFDPSPYASGPTCSVIDIDDGFAYFGIPSYPGRIYRLDLTSFNLSGPLSLSSGENSIRSAVIDPGNDAAYFGTYTSPGRVVKVDLLSFSRVGAVTMGSGEDRLVAAAIDPVDGYACFGTSTSPARMVKVGLDPFVQIGAETLNSGENIATTALIEPETDLAYVTTQTSPSHVVAVDTSSMSRIGRLTLSGDPRVTSGVIDPEGDAALYGTTSSAEVIKVRLSDLSKIDDAPVTPTSALVSAAIDPDAGYAYFGSYLEPGKIIKVGIGTECRETTNLVNGRWTQIALACEPRKRTVADVFGDDGMGTYTVDWAMFEHDPISNSYRRLEETDTLAHGFGYWIKTITGDHIVGTEGDSPNESQTYEISLEGDTGGLFNMIGHPFISSVDWANVSVDVGGGTFKTVSSLNNTEATTILSSAKWEYNGNSYDLCDPRAVCETEDDPTLESFDGLWVKAFTDTTLRVPAPVDGRPKHTAPEQNGWYLRLTVEADGGNLQDRSNLFGRLEGALDGLDPLDGEELEPFISPYLTAVFPHPEWGTGAWGYTADYREARPGAGGTWRFEVRSDVPRDVTLSWSAGGAASGFLERCRLVDVDNGVVIDPSATGSFTVEMTTTVRSFDWVINSLPVVDVGPDRPADLAVEFNLFASFVDEDEGDLHVATIDWGDGVVESGIIDQGSGTVTGQHLYLAPGTYSIEVRVEDQHVGAGSDSFLLEVIDSLLFMDAFESGNTDRWGSSTDG